MSNNYDASDIQILEGLLAVRKRPGMYIGSTDSKGLHHLVWEILDNSIDEALNGHGEQIKVIIHSDDSVSVSDNGRGMPVAKHKSGISALQVIFTKLHAGGKFSSEGGYKTSGGLHGVGASVVNALSSKVLVISARDGKKYQMKFKDGGSKASKLEVIGNGKTTGSYVRFWPDSSIFTTLDFSYATIATKLQQSAFLMPGIIFELADERSGKSEVFQYQQGLSDFVKHLVKDENVLMHQPVALSGEGKHIKVDVAFSYTTKDKENIISFANMVNTKDGGTHESGLKSAFTKAFNDYAKNNALIKESNSFDGIEVREGLYAIVSLGIEEDVLQFEGQTKNKLGTPSARSIVENLVYDQLIDFLNNHKELAQSLINKMLQAQAVREAVRKAREQAKKKNSKKIEKIISGKLAAANSKKPEEKELFLVEGDSAGGSAKQGRNSKYQAILPLRGKVLNTMKVKLSEVEKNEELATIINCLQAGVGEYFNIADSQYHKIIIMTDADTDGAHIQTLLLTFFYNYMRPLIENGYIFIAQPPLYKISSGSKNHYCYSEEDLKQYRKIYDNKRYTIQRYKGLGEMNADQLWDTTMDPESRSLIKVNIEDFNVAERKLKTLMGDNPALRRDWIEDNVDFSMGDEYEK
ncbi:MAG: type IIA DNA topoisomerase subunit B [Erysipelotrichaceae bacterium]